MHRVLQTATGICFGSAPEARLKRASGVLPQTPGKGSEGIQRGSGGARPYMHFGLAKGLENAYSDRKMSFSSCFDSLFGAWQSWTLGVLLPSVPWLRLSSSGPTGDTLLLSLF